MCVCVCVCVFFGDLDRKIIMVECLRWLTAHTHYGRYAVVLIAFNKRGFFIGFPGKLNSSGSFLFCFFMCYRVSYNR